MLTRNFMSALGNNNGLNLDNCPTAKTTKGDTNSIRVEFGSGSVYSFLQSDKWIKAKFVLGTGITKPNIEDYHIETEITKSYDCSSPLLRKYIPGNKKDNLNISGIITNTDTTDIEFTEVGLYCYIDINGGSYIMLAREVYDTPITIAPGESVAVNVNII